MNKRARHFAAVDTGIQKVDCPEQAYRFKSCGKYKFKLSTAIVDVQDLLPYPDIRSAEDFMKNIREVAYLGMHSSFNERTILGRQIAEGMHYLYKDHEKPLPYTVFNLTINLKNKAPVNYLTTGLNIQTDQKVKTTPFTFGNFGLVGNEGFVDTPPCLRPVLLSAVDFGAQCKKNQNLNKLYPKAIDTGKWQNTTEQSDDGIVHVGDFRAARRFNAEINTLGNYVIYMDGYALKKKVTDFALHRDIPTWIEVPNNQTKILRCYHMTAKDYKEKMNCYRISSVSKPLSRMSDIFNTIQLKHFASKGVPLLDDAETNLLMDMYEELENQGEDPYFEKEIYWPLANEEEEAYCDAKFYNIQKIPGHNYQ